LLPFRNDDNPIFASVIFYFGASYANWIKSAQKVSPSQATFRGETQDLGSFKIKLEVINNSEKPNVVFVDQTYGNLTLAYIKEELLRNNYFDRVKASTKIANLKEYIGFGDPPSSSLEDSNFIAYQVSGVLPFEFEIIYESNSLRKEYEEKNLSPPKELKGLEFDSVLSDWHTSFSNKFESLFQLREKNFSSMSIMMAQATLSNLLGGIGFFTGQSIVKSLNNKEPVLYWQSNLYTAVPSRSFFPRGFLWDEGFHNLLISHWDLEITRDILGHWLDLMNVEGWIPREVILGDEAKAKVPQEFWIQNNQFANPPTLFLPLYKVIHRVNESIVLNKHDTPNDPDVIYLNRIFKRLTHWYDWFNNTQVGKLPFTYRWRGRISDSKQELNPKTLTSGLDDYPRASHPTDQERHLDLRCWIALASKVMADLSEIVTHNHTSNLKPYRTHYETLKNNKILNDLHWSNSQYADYGLHSDRVKLVRQKPLDERTPPNSMPMVRLVEVEPTYQYINSVGYVSLFPILLELIDADSPNLGVVLDQIRDPKHLWTNYGLRSLSKQAPIYDKRNTEHDPPYWRGAIWININYLALKALKHYSNIEGPHKEKATSIYNELRQNLITNIQRNYETTGYLWEQYNDQTGKGQGSHPFTGWSSLVVLIMAEVY
jgi:mannosyl-oligosaccharide glucosidase